MTELRYDLHIHTCLSPCADEEMTPNNIVNLALLLGLDVIGVTDHNTARNGPAVWRVGREKGLLVLPGMELETAEEVHVVCLFPEPEAALEFEGELSRYFRPLKNRPELFGRQIVMDWQDNPIAEEERLLLGATRLGIDRAAELAVRFGGTAFPAHIDRPAGGILSQLGFIPTEMGFSAVELSASADVARWRESRPELEKFRVLCNSDAHTLCDISMMKSTIQTQARAAEAVIAALNARC